MKRLTLCIILFTTLFYGNTQDFVWAEKYEGDSFLSAQEVLFDSTGNRFLIGTFSKFSDFQDTYGDELEARGPRDIFIQKTSTTGKVEWGKTIGGEEGEKVHRTILGKNGDIILTGDFRGVTNFNLGDGSPYLYSESSNSPFVLSLTPEGKFRNSNMISGGKLLGVDTDQEGNIYTTGYFGGYLTVQMNGSMESIPSFEGTNIFIHKINPKGQTVWLKTMGDLGTDQGQGIQVDQEDNIYCLGTFRKRMAIPSNKDTTWLDLDTAKGTFLLKLRPNGDLVWATVLDVPSLGQGPILRITEDNQIYVLSEYGDKGFMMFLNSSGEEIWYNEIENLTEPSYFYMSDAVVGLDNQLIITGNIFGAFDFDPSNAKYEIQSLNYRASEGEIDCYIAAYSQSGEFLWVNKTEGLEGEYSNSIALDPSGDAWIFGRFDNEIKLKSKDFSYYKESNQFHGALFLAKIKVNK